ncbi:MAG: 50S ribosomal protein L19e [Candidatus Woesearchaeota archaeon]
MKPIQKRLAAKITKRSVKKIKFDPLKINKIKEAITRADVKSLIKDNAIIIEKDKGISKARIRKAKKQRAKGRRIGPGSRKGKATARNNPKRAWINKMRLQRSFLKNLKEKGKITNDVYKDLYLKSKGGFFRSKRHIKLYLTEKKLIKTD